MLGNHVPEDQIVHCVSLVGRIPLTRADYGIGSLGGGTNDCVNFLYMHERVNGHMRSLFSPARNRLLKIWRPSTNFGLNPV
jgi:hypothetical protein